jgi:ion channel-forming bestrophin family protein
MNDILMESSFYPHRSVSKNRYWQQLIMTTRMFARVIWIHAKEHDGEQGKEDLLAKLFFFI